MLESPIVCCQVWFESYQPDTLNFESSSELALFAVGRCTGVVLDVGWSTMSSSAICEGYDLGVARCSKYGATDTAQESCAPVAPHLQHPGTELYVDSDITVADETL